MGLIKAEERVQSLKLRAARSAREAKIYKQRERRDHGWGIMLNKW
jgi:hypothetical protein